MDAGFWHARWQNKEIGFHQAEINAYLQRHWPTLEVTSNDAVLVPLCGKSLDLVWLAQQGHHVQGVELSDIAARAFFAEASVDPSTQPRDHFTVYSHATIDFFCGDFFQLTVEQLNPFAAIYDRAALVAMPSNELRDQYAQKLTQLAAPGTKMLLITMEYPTPEMGGPPFSVEEAQVHKLYAADWQIQCLEQRDVLQEYPPFQQKGLSRLTEKAFLLVRN